MAELNPIEPQPEVEEAPQPELVQAPQPEAVQEAKPVIDQAPKPEVAQAPQPFDYEMLQGAPTGYMQLPTNVVGQAEGSLWKANFVQQNSIGAFINSVSSNAINQEAAKSITTREMINLIPRDLVLDYADRYVGKDPTHFDEVTDQIRSELNDKAIIAAHPWQSFAISFPVQALDPINWLPLGALYKNSKRASGLARAIIGSGATVAFGTAIQESILQRNQLTREAQESVFNIATAAVIGGALGGLGVGITARNRGVRLREITARRNAAKEVMDVFTDTDKQLDANGLLKDQDLANLPGFVRTAMKITPMNRLVNSVSDTAKFFANAIYEHNYTLMKHMDERTDGASVETLTRLDVSKTKSMMVEYQKIFYNMLGIDSGPFKGTRAKLADAGMNYDQFNEAVWQRLSTQVDHPSEYVNRAAKLLEDKLFNPTRDKAVELGLLDEKQVPRNSLGYITSVYNKNKIIEQGGKSARGPGSFPQFLYEKFTEIQNQIKQFISSPAYLETQAKIQANKLALKGRSAEEKKLIDQKIIPINKRIREIEANKSQRPKTEIKAINEQIKNLTAEVKEHQTNIAEKQKDYESQIQNEVNSFKDELFTTKKKVAPHDLEIKKLETARIKARERRLILQERLKAKTEGTKTHQAIASELDKISSVLIENNKNIDRIKSERDSIKPTIKDIEADIKRMQKLKALDAQGIPELKETIKDLKEKIESHQSSKIPSKDEIKSFEKEIKSLREKIDKIESEKKLPKDEIKRLEDELNELEKNRLNGAPRKGLNSDGELFDVVDDKTLWSHVEQTIDHILGDSEGQMLNPILDKLKGGASPLKSRKMTVDQSQMMDWHITDIPKIVDMYSRAMHPTIRLTEFAKKLGAKDIPEMREKLSEMIMKEYDEKMKNEFNKKGSVYYRGANKRQDHSVMENATLGKGYWMSPLADTAKAYGEKVIKIIGDFKLYDVLYGSDKDINSIYSKLSFTSKGENRTKLLAELHSIAKEKGYEGFKRVNEVMLFEKPFDKEVKVVTGKEASKLRKQRDSDIADMKVSLALMQGVYGDGPNVLNSSAKTFYQNVMKWNYVRLLGYMTISSLADAGIQVFVHGPYRFIHEGLVQSFSGVRQIAKQDLRAIGYALETELGTRIKSYVEHSGLSTNPGPFTKGLDALTQGFGNLSLMNQWNEWQQSMAGHIGINRTLQTIHKFMKGEKVTKIDMERVIKNGLDKEHWKTIYEFTKDNDSDGTLFADWTNWDIKNKEQAEALTQFQASIAKEIDNIVIVPGLGDKIKIGILDAHTPIGKLLFQFKSFLMAATNRVTVSGIQRRNDVNTYLGVVSMLGMGAMSYVVASLLKGKDPDLSFGNLSREAIDKSGLLGIWGELGSIGQKALGFNTTSRYASRDTMGAFMGPTFGAASELISVLNAITNSLKIDGDPLTTKDAQKLMRLAPMQNLFYLEQLNRKATRGIALGLGATDKD